MNFPFRIWLLTAILPILPLNQSKAQEENDMAYSADTAKAEAGGKAEQSVYRFKAKQLIVPTLLIGTGIVGLESDWLKYHNKEIRDELQENIDNRFTFDDFSQYVPMAATYLLKVCKVKSRHDYAETSVILATSYLFMGISVNTLKATSHVLRPDSSTYNSFPSGHTATAFMGAELLRREYWNVSPWIGVGGYTVAAFTGFFRMYNNRHWFTDVLAGAGIGILSVQVGYWLYPCTSRLILGRGKKKINMQMLPYVSGDEKGVSCCMVF